MDTVDRCTSSRRRTTLRHYSKTEKGGPVVQSGCEACSLTLMTEHRLRASENTALRNLSRPTTDEVT
jgi:hypothetical protein